MLYFGGMISLDDLLIESNVVGTKFSCDLAQCKGACCTLSGGGGAPVLDKEVEELKAAIPAAKKYLSHESIAHIEKHGALEGNEGNWETGCIDDKACVFVVWDGDVAHCSIEKAYHNGETTFRKPLSCHLFPIRVANFGGPYLRYEVFDECAPGRKLGEQTNTPLVVAVKDALERGFGKDTMEAMVELALQTNEGGTR